MAARVPASEDELDNPRSLALPDWDALQQLGAALVARSHGRYAGWADIVEFTACTAARIGETSGVRRADINCRALDLERPSPDHPGSCRRCR